MPTHGSDTVLRCPRGENDRVTLRQLNDDVMAAIFSGDTLEGGARDSSIIKQLSKLDKKWSAM